MKKLTHSLVAISLILSLNGCAVWWQTFKNDPVSQIQFILDQAGTAQAIANIAWNSVKGMLPVEKQAKAQLVFDKVMLTFNKSVEAAHAAIQAAVDLKQDKPDFSKVKADLMAAAAAIVDLINGFVQTPGVMGVSGEPKFAATDISGYQELKDQLDALKATADRMKP